MRRHSQLAWSLIHTVNYITCWLWLYYKFLMRIIQEKRSHKINYVVLYAFGEHCIKCNGSYIDDDEFSPVWKKTFFYYLTKWLDLTCQETMYSTLWSLLQRKCEAETDRCGYILSIYCKFGCSITLKLNYSLWKYCVYKCDGWHEFKTIVKVNVAIKASKNMLKFLK